MHNHHITQAIAEAQVAEMQRTATRNRPTAPVHPRPRRRLRALALGLAACTAVAAPAGAQPIRDAPAHNPGAQAAKADETAGDIATGARWTALARSYALATPKVGDTPIDDPGASRAPENTAPTTIEVVRPERTIVRDIDDGLPVVLSSAALLVALGGCAFLLVASIRRRRLGSTP